MCGLQIADPQPEGVNGHSSKWLRLLHMKMFVCVSVCLSVTQATHASCWHSPPLCWFSMKIRSMWVTSFVSKEFTLTDISLSVLILSAALCVFKPVAIHVRDIYWDMSSYTRLTFSCYENLNRCTLLSVYARGRNLMSVFGRFCTNMLARYFFFEWSYGAWRAV